MDQSGSLGRAQRISVGLADKGLVIGDFKTGKTTFLRYLAERFPRYLIWDPRFQFGERSRSMSAVRSYFEKFGRSVYQPGRGDLEAKLNEFCEYALTQANAAVMIDEPMMVDTLPQSFWDLWRLGHARNLGMWVATHRIQGDLPALFTVVNHMVVFRCTVIWDVYTLKGILGDEGAAWVQRAPDRHFWYRGTSWQGPQNPVRLRN